jgi:hypothetical protein
MKWRNIEAYRIYGVKAKKKSAAAAWRSGNGERKWRKYRQKKSVAEEMYQWRNGNEMKVSAMAKPARLKEAAEKCES